VNRSRDESEAQDQRYGAVSVNSQKEQADHEPWYGEPKNPGENSGKP
jgi:hypothetical protein